MASRMASRSTTTITSKGRELRVAVFEREKLQEHLRPSVYERTGGYLQLLQSAFTHVLDNSSSLQLRSDCTISHHPPYPSSLSLTGFDTKAEEYPSDLGEFDGVLITGSLSGVYDGEPWIQRLLHEIRILDERKIKTVGISFGHQAIAQALGGHVQRNPKGSEVSVRSAWVTERGQILFNPLKKEFQLHYHHNDAILNLPPDFWVLASNNVTEFQSIYKPYHFLTFCGHPDYSHTIEVLEQLLEYDRQKLWVPEQLIEHGLATLSQPTDYEWVIKQISRFYLGDFDKLAESALTSSTVKN
ncbi:hypothetical protein CY35_03G094600 [Sphagnum magellanicum]|nr:hypothetical protein CY35_03G094600 [Sphagnum magellanicum]